MRFVRDTLGIIAGYAVFAVSAVLLFRLAAIDPHAEPAITTAALVIVYGILFSFAGGYLAQVISGSGNAAISYFLAVIMAAFAAFSLFKSAGNHYTQFAAIFSFAPASLLGGLARLKHIRNSVNQ